MHPRAQAPIVIALVLLLGLFYCLTIRPGHYWGDDFALYIAHARNIVDGIPYSDTGYIFNPSAPSLSPIAYPPIFPLLLAPVYAVFGINLAAMKILVIVTFLLFLITLFFLLRSELPFTWLLALILLIGLNPFFWELKDRIMSDYPFLLLVYLTLLCVKRFHTEAAGQSGWLPHGALTGALIYLAYGTRSLGVVLAGTLLLLDMVRLRRITRFTLVATAVFAAGAVTQTALLSDAGAYTGQLPTSLKHVPGNLAFYARTFSLLWDSGQGWLTRYTLAILAGILALAGYILRCRRKLGLLEIFLPLYLVPVTVWSGHIDRYLLPIFPLVFFYMLAGLEALRTRCPLRLRRPLCGALMALVAGVYLARYSTLDFGPVREGVATRETLDLFDYVRSSRQDDVFIFRKPRALALYTGRKASVYHVGASDEELWAWFDRIGATHFIVCDEDPAAWSGFLERSESRLRPAYSNAGFRVFVRRGAGGAGAGSLRIPRACSRSSTMATPSSMKLL